MRILQIYNRYQSGGGGETRVVELIEQVLVGKGHEVKTLMRDSNSINGAIAKLGLVFTSSYSPEARRTVRKELLRWQPNVVHVHNLYPLFSPSVLHACRELNIPVVMTVHNYGLTCPVGTHFQSGAHCLRCVGGREYHCVLKNCKQDLIRSASYAFRSTVARVTGQFQTGVTLFLAISDFVKQQMVQAGFSANQIIVLNNAVPIPEEPGTGDSGYVAFFGRMAAEKGLDTLLDSAVALPECRFVFVGDGPERARCASIAPPNCSFLGHQSRTAVEEVYQQARLVVVPSLWCEPFGLTAIEAMSYGKPVIVARSGALPGLVEENITGLAFEPGDAAALTISIRKLWSDVELCQGMGRAGREEVKKRYSLSNYSDKLIACYEQAMGSAANV